MKRPTHFHGIQATCEDCQRFASTVDHHYKCLHKQRSARPDDTICDCFRDCNGKTVWELEQQ